MRRRQPLCPIRERPDAIEATLRILRNHRVFWDRACGCWCFSVVMFGADGSYAESTPCALFSRDRAPREPGPALLHLYRKRLERRRNGRYDPPPAAEAAGATE